MKRLDADTPELLEWNGILLPPLPPDYMWITFMKEPAVARVGSGALWKSYPHGWVKNYIDRIGSGMVRTHEDAKPLYFEIDTQDVKDTIHALAQYFWLGVFE